MEQSGSRQLHIVYVVRIVVRIQRKRFSKRDGGCRTVLCSVLRLVVPLRSARTYQKAPCRGKIHRQFVLLVAFAFKRKQIAIAVVQVFCIGSGRCRWILGGTVSCLDLCNSYSGPIGVLPVERKGEFLVAGCGNREPLAGIVTGGSFCGNHRNVSGCDIGCRGIGKDVILSVRTMGSFYGLLKPPMLPARVIDYVIHVNFYTLGVGRLDQPGKILHGTVPCIQSGVIQYVVPVVRHGRMNGRKPDGRSPQPVYVVQFVDNPGEIAPSVTVAVCKRVNKELIRKISSLVSVPRLRCCHYSNKGFVFFVITSARGHFSTARYDKEKGAQDQSALFYLIHSM